MLAQVAETRPALLAFRLGWAEEALSRWVMDMDMDMDVDVHENV
jgi:hypothetical protein